MSQIDRERESDNEDEPLSAEAQAIMDKARRRAGLSIGLMLFGFMAIAFAVVYRLATMSETPGAQYALETMSLPVGAQVISTQLDDGLVSVTYALAGSAAVRIFDGEDGALVREIAITAE